MFAGSLAPFFRTAWPVAEERNAKADRADEGSDFLPSFSVLILSSDDSSPSSSNAE